MASKFFLTQSLGAGLLVATLAFSSDARGAEPAARPSAPADGPATAEQLADKGFAAYEGGDYAAAIGLYLQSFQLSGDARVLFNVASIYDKKLRDRRLAEDFYRRYLRSSTTEPELVKKANDRLIELKNESETLSENRDANAPVGGGGGEPPARGEAPQGGFPWKPVGLGFAGVGLIGIGVGAVFGLSALSKADDVRTQCPNDVCPTADGAALRNDAADAATLSTIFFAGGFALAAGGAAMFFLAPKGAMTTTGVRLQPSFGASRAGAALSGTF